MFHSILLGINLKDLLYLYEQAHIEITSCSCKCDWWRGRFRFILQDIGFENEQVALIFQFVCILPAKIQYTMTTRSLVQQCPVLYILKSRIYNLLKIENDDIRWSHHFHVWFSFHLGHCRPLAACKESWLSHRRCRGPNARCRAESIWLGDSQQWCPPKEPILRYDKHT